MNEQEYIDSLIDLGASDEEITEALSGFRKNNSSETTPVVEEPPQKEVGFWDSIRSGLDTATDYVGAGVGAVNRGLSKLVSEPLKFEGAIEQSLGMKNPLQTATEAIGLTEESEPWALRAGRAVEGFAEGLNPRYNNVNETYQAVGEGVGQGLGMMATAGIGAANAGLQMANTTTGLLPATGRALVEASKSITSTAGFLGGSMTASPEWEAAKAAGKSDEEAFEVLLPNFFIGTFNALPIQNMLGNLNRVTGNQIVNTAKAMGIGGIEEFAQEGIQTYLTNEVAKETYDPDRDPLFQVLESAEVGGMVGMFLPGMVSVARTLSAEKRVKLERRINEIQANEALRESTTGDPLLDNVIDAPAQLTNEEKDVIEAPKIEEEIEAEQKELEQEAKKRQQAEKSAANTDTNLDSRIENPKDIASKELDDLVTSGDISRDGKKVTILTEKGGKEVKRIQESLIPTKEVDIQSAQFEAENSKSVRDIEDQIRNIQPDQDITELVTKLNESKQQRDNARIAFEEARKSKPRVEKSVKMTPSQAIEKQLKDFTRGEYSGLKKGTEGVNELVTKVRDAIKEFPLSLKQTESILTKVKNTSLTADGFSRNSVNKLNQYIDNVTKDAEYSEKLATAEKTIKDIKKTFSKASVPEKPILKVLVQIDPSEVDVAEFQAIAEQVKPGFKSVTSKDYSPLTLKPIEKYIEATTAKIYESEFGKAPENLDPQQRLDAVKESRSDKRQAERLEKVAEELGLSLEEQQQLLAEDSPLDDSIADNNKKEKLRESLANTSKVLQGRLPASRTDTKENSILKEFKRADVSKLTVEQLKNFIKAVDRMTINEDFGAAGFLAPQLNINESFESYEKVSEGVTPLGIGSWEKEMMSSFPMVIKAVTGLRELAAKFQERFGITGLSRAASIALTEHRDKYIDARNKLADTLSKLYGSINNGFSDDSIFRRGIYLELIRHKSSADPNTALAENKAVIQEHIRTLKDEKGKSKDAAKIEALYSDFKDAKTIEEVQSKLQKIDPAGKKVADWMIEWFKPYGKIQDETNYLYYNKPFEEVINYGGERKYLSTASKDTKIENPLEKTYNQSLKPQQDSSGKEFTGKVQPEGILELNADVKAADQVHRIALHAEALPHILKVRAMIKQKARVKKLFGYQEGNDAAIEQADKIFEAVFNKTNGSYFVKEKEYLGTGSVTSTEFDKKFNKVFGGLKQLGTIIRLSGISQVAKQIVVLSNVGMKLGRNSIFLAESLGDLMTKKESVMNFLTGTPVKGREHQGMIFNMGDLYTAGVDKRLKDASRSMLYKNISGIWENRFTNILTGTGAMMKTDVNAAHASFLSFYKDYLNRNGEEFKGWDTEALMRDTESRRDALAWSQQMVDELQGVSNPADLPVSFNKRNWGHKLLIAAINPFGSFSGNTKARLLNDWTQMRVGSRTKNTKQFTEGGKDILQTSAELFMYQIVNQFVLGAAFNLIGDGVRELFDLDDEKDKEQQMRTWWQRTWAGVMIDLIPFVMTNLGDAAVVEGVNEAAYQLYKQQSGDDVTRKKYEDAIGYPLYQFNEDNSNLTKILNLLGPAAAPFDVLIKSGKALHDGATNEEYSEGQQKLAYLAAMLQAGQLGFIPQDLTTAVNREYNNQKKSVQKKDAKP